MQYVQHCILSTCAVLSQAWCAGNNHHEEVCIREGVLRAVSLCRCMHGAYYLLLLRVAIKRKQQHGRRLLCAANIMRSGQQQACVLSPSVCACSTQRMVQRMVVHCVLALVPTMYLHGEEQHGGTLALAVCSSTEQTACTHYHQCMMDGSKDVHSLLHTIPLRSMHQGEQSCYPLARDLICSSKGL